MNVSAWITSIVGAVCLSTLTEVIMSEGETKKFVKGICALLIFAVIIAPLPALFGGDAVDFSAYTAEQDAVDTEYLDRIESEQTKALELYAQKRLAAEGYAELTVRISKSTVERPQKITAVVVDKTLLVITREVQNIDITEEIKRITAAAIGVEKGLVAVIG